MAKGWTSLHPFQEQRLRAVGLNGNQITQGWGSAVASAGSHEPVGTRDGRQFGHCIDLSVSFEPNRANFDALVRAGFCPFYRDWPGNRHQHVVDVTWIKNDAGLVPRHLVIPRDQVQDFLKTPPRNGLVGHAVLPAAWAPTKAQQAYLRNLWENGAMPEGYASQEGPLKVIGLDGQPVDCHPEVVNGRTRGDIAAIAEALGFEAHWRPDLPQGDRVYLKAKEA